MVVDDGEDIIDVPITLVEPLKRNVDGSATFRLFGGPFHGQIVRIYNDKQMAYARVVFDLHGEPCVYKMSPPAKGTRGKWVYMYDPDDRTPLTETEKGDIPDPEAADRWMNYLAFKRLQEIEKFNRTRIEWEGEIDVEASDGE